MRFGKKPLRGRARGQTHACLYCGKRMQTRYLDPNDYGPGWRCRGRKACAKREGVVQG